MIFHLGLLYSAIVITFELCVSLKGKRPLITLERYKQIKDGWTVANPQMLSYCFIPRNVPKPSSDKLRVSNRKGQNGTISMKQIAIGGEMICKGG